MVRSRLFSIIYGILLVCFTAFAVLEGFVIPQTYAAVDGPAQMAAESRADSPDAAGQADQAGASSGGETGTSTGEDGSSLGADTAIVTDTTYTRGETTITLTTYREHDTNIYVADVQLGSTGTLGTAFAQNIYGKNVTAATSQIAEGNDAVLAINGDYYSARSGYVIRNGVLYSSQSADPDQEDLVIYEDGSMDVVREGDITAQALLDAGAQQVFCFGPALVEDGQVSVSQGQEVSGKSMASNPRTAIGWISDTHYLFVVSDGRTSESAGLDLDELAEFMQRLGCREGYNLDGGGSSTMYFNGRVINKPTTNGGHIHERSVSDIVYIK